VVTIDLQTGTFTGVTGTSQNVEAFVGNDAGATANTTLSGPNAGATFQITGPNSGTVGTVAFSQVGNLTGGTGNDSFVLNGGHIAGAMNGGLGTNTLTGNSVASTWTINATNAGTLTDGGTTTFTNMQSLVGGTAVDSFALIGTGHVTALDGGSGAVNTLTGNNLANAWAITGPNSGTLTDANGTNAFSNIQSLVGNAAADSFVLSGTGHICCSINGGGGTNTLTGNNLASTWSFTGANAGTLTDSNGSNAFVNIQNIVGGTAIDALDLTAAPGATFNLNTNTASFGPAGTFSSIEQINGTNANITGSNAGVTYNLSGAGTGTAGGIGYSGITNITAGSGADTFQGGGSISGNLDAGGGTTTISGTYSTGGSQQYTGAVTIGGVTSITAGSSVTFSSTVTGATFNFGVVAGTTLTPGPGMNVGSGIVTLSAGAIAGGSITSTTQGILSSSTNVSGLAVDFQNLPLLLTGSASSWTLSGPGIAPAWQVTNSLTNITYNGTPIQGAIVVAQGQSGAIIGSTLAEIARAALLESQDTDSVAKQMVYGFAGDVGTTPPMNHQIDDTGISVPACFNDSREGQTCK
jgi:hypothetical protein